MFCANCGNKVEDGLSFCTNCGAKLEGPANAQPVPPIHDNAPVQPVQPAPQQPVMDQQVIQQPAMGQTAAAAKKLSLDKKQIKKIGILAGAAVVAIAAFVGVVKLVSSSGSSSSHTLFKASS